MSPGMITLLAGALLAVGGLAFVLHPLFFDVRERPRARPGPTPPDDSAIVALREIEFDKATGKLSDADYAQLKKAYSARALNEMRARDRDSQSHPERSDGSAITGANSLDPIEARVREYRETHRACHTCGVRPEPDALYCSTCGGFLDRSCPRCAAPVTESSASYCSSCGMALGATVSP
jgi:hypothetical protein